MQKLLYERRRALSTKNISFTLNQGEIVSLLRPSDSGKSTILNILTNLIEPTSDEVIIYYLLSLI